MEASDIVTTNLDGSKQTVITRETQDGGADVYVMTRAGTSIRCMTCRR
jgi:hypothetical protein